MDTEQIHEHEHTHTYTHSHPHDHSHTEGHDHAHEHELEHDHAHEHRHEHAHHAGEVEAPERTRALLAYMIDHNDHHAGELTDLLDSLEGAPRRRLLDAIAGFEAANAQLREVLELLKQEG